MEKNISCLTTACTELGVAFEFIDEEHNFLRITLKGEVYYFQLNRTPFNSESIASICKDKFHTHCLLKDFLRFPKTLSFMSYNVDERYKSYLKYQSSHEILQVIEAELTYPFIIKSNSGSFGSNVFLCETDDAAREAIEQIFNKHSHLYDYILLAQEFIRTKEEYRLVCYRGTPVLVYRRSANPHRFNARYWEDASSKAVLITDGVLISELQAFVSPTYSVLDIGFVGFDIVRSLDDSLYLLELNSGPRFDHFIESNGTESVIKMYKTMLTMWLSEKRERADNR